MSQVKDYIVSNTAFGWAGILEDICGVVAFCCSDAADWSNEQKV